MRKMDLLMLSFAFFAPTLHAASVEANVACPQSEFETCRWKVESRAVSENGHLSVIIDWEKSIVSNHWRKPSVAKLACNLDRSFNPHGGGYIHVWFDGASQPCDPMTTNPADCGVTFFLADPSALYSARGFRVTAPSGKALRKVEHYSTLDLQCGDLGQPSRAKGTWNSRVGWDREVAGDGTYSANGPVVPDAR